MRNTEGSGIFLNSPAQSCTSLRDKKRRRASILNSQGSVRRQEKVSAQREPEHLKSRIESTTPETAMNSGISALGTGVLSCLFVLLWSSGWVGSKFGLDYSGPFTFLTIRYTLVVIILSLLLAFLSTVKPLTKLSPTELLFHALVGLLSHGIYLGTSVTAMTYGASAGLVAFLSAMQPLFTTLCAGIILHESAERASRMQWFGIGLGVLAIYITLATNLNGNSSVIAYLLLLASVCAISIATLVDRKITLRRKKLGHSPSHLIQIIWVHCLSALLFFSVVGWFLEGFKATWNTEYLLTIVYMAVIVSIGSYGLMYRLLRRMTAVNVSSLIYLTPPTTVLLAWFSLGETLTPNGIAGLAIGGIAVAVVLKNGRGHRQAVQ